MVSRLVELGRNIDVLVARRSKRISLGRTWLKPKGFGRAGRNVSRLVELGRNIDVCGRADRNISR